MRRSVLVLSLLLAGAPTAPAAHAEACSEVWITGTSVPNRDAGYCVREIDTFLCEHQGAGVAPDVGVAVEICL